METTIINSLGQLSGWNSINFRMLGRDVVGIKKIAYDDDQDKGNEMGAGKYPVGTTDGNYTAKASIEVLNEEFLAMQASLPRGKRIQDIAPSDVIVSYDYNDRIVDDIIHNVRFKNNGVDVKQGDGSIVRKFDLVITHITWGA